MTYNAEAKAKKCASLTREFIASLLKNQDERLASPKKSTRLKAHQSHIEAVAEELPASLRDDILALTQDPQVSLPLTYHEELRLEKLLREWASVPALMVRSDAGARRNDAAIDATNLKAHALLVPLWEAALADMANRFLEATAKAQRNIDSYRRDMRDAAADRPELAPNLDAALRKIPSLPHAPEMNTPLPEIDIRRMVSAHKETLDVMLAQFRAACTEAVGKAFACAREFEESGAIV